MSASPRAKGSRPAGQDQPIDRQKVIMAREKMQTQKPSRKALRRPMASTSEPTRTVKRVMAVDQAVTMKPARVSE